MNVLQLTSDWKWTGPAEPMLNLARALEARGHAVLLAAPEAPDRTRRSVANEARAAGLECALALDRARGVRPLRDLRDVRGLRHLIAERAIDVVHCWHTRDHLLALRATRARRARGETVIVRSERRAELSTGRPFGRWLLGSAADGLLCVSPIAAEQARAFRGARPTCGLFGAVDPVRFAPACGSERDASAPRSMVRRQLGFRPEDRVVGIVARVQRHRRFDLLLEAAARLFATHADARLLVIGRGTHREALAEAPAQRLGIAERVCFAGHRTDDYVEVLRAIDVFTFLVPGSDGTCRALLEAAACGIPAVTTRRGALPEIVEHGRTGLLVDETPDALAAGWRTLLDDDSRRREMGTAAAVRARTLFAPERFAAESEWLYREAVRARRTTGARVAERERAR